MEYTHGLDVLCYVLFISSIHVDSYNTSTQMLQGCFTATGQLKRLFWWQWCSSYGYGKIGRYLTKRKQNVVETVHNCGDVLFVSYVLYYKCSLFFIFQNFLYIWSFIIIDWLPFTKSWDNIPSFPCLRSQPYLRLPTLWQYFSGPKASQLLCAFIYFGRRTHWWCDSKAD